MSAKEGYDIRRAPNAAPIINRYCGKSIVAVFDYCFDTTKPSPTEKQAETVKSFLRLLKRNLDRMDRHLPPVQERN